MSALKNLTAIVVAALIAVPASGEGLSGAYLAARSADAAHDFEAAARYFTRALIEDPSNAGLLEEAAIANLGRGDFSAAIAISQRLAALTDTSQIANIVLLADAVAREDYEAALAIFDRGATIGPLVDGLAQAWIHVGQGKMSEALADFDAVGETAGLNNFALYHKALALALVGDLEGAEAIFSGQAGGALPPTVRGIVAHAEILSGLERNEDAVAMIDAVVGPALDPTMARLRARLVAGEQLPLQSVRSARDGLAEVFFSVAGALMGEANDSYTLAYTRIAEYLRPNHIDAILMTAQLLENLGQYQLATDAYDQIPRDDPAFMAAELGRANALRLSDKNEAAIEVLKQLAKSHPDQPAVFSDLGDLYRRLERYQEAAEAYDRAIDLYGTAEPSHWVLYFTRGIAFERTDQWEKAEADFRKALELNPDQPQVLNYLGYSLVEKQVKLDEALDMIQRAVDARPDDGYITDSLGWVFYRLGRYDEAVQWMEKAVELNAVDPIINDHLGDVYWAVGRKREAEFQWKRALSFDPEEEDARRVRRKLEVGLDAVLAEEGAPPLHVANDG